MASAPHIEPFGGEINKTIQPKDFLKTFQRTMWYLAITSDKDHIECFVDHLVSDSPAEEWYADKGSMEILWQAFGTKLLARFSGAEAAKKTAPELEREMLEMRLKTEDMDKMEMHLGVAVETHKVFADKLLDLAKWVKLEKTTTSIWQVRGHLPDILKK
jgi:hypothetical protein